jgi:hypothetical protein
VKTPKVAGYPEKKDEKQAWPDEMPRMGDEWK